MDNAEAKEWLGGKRSMINLIPSDDLATWQVRVAAANASMIQQAYYIAMYHDAIATARAEALKKAEDRMVQVLRDMGLEEVVNVKRLKAAILADKQEPPK